MSGIDHTHDPEAACWVPGAADHAEFPVQNLPLGVFSPADDERPRGGIAIGDFILDLGAAASALTGQARLAAEAAAGPDLNALLALGPTAHRALRHGVFALLSDPAAEAAVAPLLHRADGCRMHLPARVGDYTDFYAGIHHAENVGRLFRPDNPLLPNYKYVPIGYHGRASSIRVSGDDVVRPRGQTRVGEAAPEYGPCARLDYELEMAIWIGAGNALGETVPIGEARRHIAGLSILNDWSARDIQSWEYQPLGPFLAKNFHSTVSPWIVTADALAPYRLPQPPRAAGDPEPLPYLFDDEDRASGAYAVRMEVFVHTARMRDRGLTPHRLSRAEMTAMYWTSAQLVAHHASNGCDLRPGDLLGTGTLSGADDGTLGSLLELTRGGREAIELPGGEARTFLEDGDEVLMTAWAEAEGRVRIGFGECRARVVGR